MGGSARQWEIQSGVKPPQSKKQGSAISREGAMIFGIGKLWDSFFFLGWAAWLFA
jgi:hypothetical protein